MPTMTDVPIPVNIYDVVTTDSPPREVVSCRSGADAQTLATQLQQWVAQGRIVDAPGFTAAAPRVVVVNAMLQTGTTVPVQGWEINVDAAAPAFIAAAVVGPLATLALAPSPVSVAAGGTVQMTATGADDRQHPMPVTPVWTATAGGTIDANGVVTAGATPGTFPGAITVTDGAITATADLQVTA